MPTSLAEGVGVEVVEANPMQMRSCTMGLRSPPSLSSANDSYGDTVFHHVEYRGRRVLMVCSLKLCGGSLAPIRDWGGEEIVAVAGGIDVLSQRCLVRCLT